jgi:hypothetical protein
VTKFKVYARDTDLSKLGTIDGYSSLSCTPRFNAVGSWSLTYPIGSLGAELLGAGRGVRIFRAGAPSSRPLMTGPVMDFVETLGPDRKTPSVKFTGVCDNFWLSSRRALPAPATDADTYAVAYDTRTGLSETVMKAYVNANAGPGALAYRRVPTLTIGPDLGRGAATSYSARFESLLELLQNLGARTGLGFQVQQIGAGLVFDVYAPRDLRKLVRFTTANRSLGAYSYSVSGPTADAVYVGDGDPGTGRSFKRFSDADVIADWGRIEAFVDQSNSQDATQVAQAGQQALDNGSPQAQVSFEPRDTPQHRYGTDFGLGDTVTVRVRLGDVADVVREVTITDDSSDGVKVRPTVGGTQASDSDNNSVIYRSLSYLGRAVGYLQRRL